MVTNRDSFASMRMGIEIAAALVKLYPKNFDATKIIALVGNAETIRRLKAGDAPLQSLPAGTRTWKLSAKCARNTCCIPKPAARATYLS